MSAGFGVRVFDEAAGDSGAGAVVVADALPAGLVTLVSGILFAGAESVTGDSTTGGARGDAGEAAAISEATGENGTASLLWLRRAARKPAALTDTTNAAAAAAMKPDP